MTRDELEVRRLRVAADDTAAWSLFATDDTTRLELEAAAHSARCQADELEGALPLGVPVP